MTYFTLYHWIYIGVLALLFGGALVWMLARLRGQFLTVGVIVLMLATAALGIIGVISLDKNLKKAKVDNVENRRNLRSETVTFTGFVRNTGAYTIGTVTYTLKLINKGNSSGRVNGRDFYQPNSIWDMLFSIGSSGQREAKPNTVEFEQVIDKTLQPGERRQFIFTVKFPSYFSDVLFREELTLH